MSQNNKSPCVPSVVGVMIQPRQKIIPFLFFYTKLLISVGKPQSWILLTPRRFLFLACFFLKLRLRVSKSAGQRTDGHFSYLTSSDWDEEVSDQMMNSVSQKLPGDRLWHEQLGCLQRGIDAVGAQRLGIRTGAGTKPSCYWNGEMEFKWWSMVCTSLLLILSQRPGCVDVYAGVLQTHSWLISSNCHTWAKTLNLPYPMVHVTSVSIARNSRQNPYILIWLGPDRRTAGGRDSVKQHQTLSHTS